MGDGLRTIRVVTTDETLLASTRAAASALEGWEVASAATLDDLFAAPPALGDVILLDGWLRSGNVYEACRRLTGRTRCRTYIVTEHDNAAAESIARFCGATGVLRRPIVPSKMREALAIANGPRAALPTEGRGRATEEAMLPERLLTDLAGKPDLNLVAALTDPETSLFN